MVLKLKLKVLSEVNFEGWWIETYFTIICSFCPDYRYLDATPTVHAQS